MDVNEILKRTENLSSFDGMLLSMLGEGDDMLHFNGGSNFAVQDLDQFAIQVVNANVAIRNSRLYSNIAKDYPTQYPGLVATGAFNDRNGAAGLSGASTSDVSIETFFYFLSKNPSRLNFIQIDSSAASQLSQNLIINYINPYRQEQNKTIYPSNERNQNVYQTTIVQFKVMAQLDYEKDIFYNFVGSSTTTVTFFMGAQLNQAKALEKKAGRANKAMNGAAPQVASLMAQKQLSAS